MVHLKRADGSIDLAASSERAACQVVGDDVLNGLLVAILHAVGF
jgi:hypothetical protein